MRTVGLFAGIGGIELGLAQAGFESVLLCEVWEPAQAVLRERFSSVPLVTDVREIDCLPKAEVVAAGFPCQDLSQAGRTRGIKGSNSGLVSEVFRLIEGNPPEWLLLENVKNMLHLDRGAAMAYLTEELERHGLSWAYRLVDTQSFGLPQRRKRVVLLASRLHDPRSVLFADDAGDVPPPDATTVGCGFYWTEGSRGLGWAIDSVPTLKGGSTIGIPSPPAIRLPDSEGIVLPEIRDAERLQGFEPDWTLPAVQRGGRSGTRWKLVGNAVSVPMSEWIGERLLQPGTFDESESIECDGRPRPWPDAAWGRDGKVFAVERSHFPLSAKRPSLLEFLQYPTTPLSERATAGFLRRARRSSLRFQKGFLDDVAAHLASVRATPIAA